MSWQSRLSNWIVSKTLRRSIQGADFRTAIKRFSSLLELAAFFVPLPVRMQRAPIVYGGVPCEWISCRSDQSTDGPMIIYLHGGAFAMGSIRTHRDIARRLAQTSGFPVLLVGYSLTPASPYPAALDDVISVYEILRAGRVFPRPLAFAGDSAGGNLAIAATFRILERGREPPFALALFSPWLDLANSANKHESGTAREYMLDRAFLESAAEEYANGIRLDDPRISPINGPIHRLPPVHVCAAETELLASDSERLVQRGQELGVDAELQLWADQMHAFPTFAAVLPEGVSAVKKAAAFLVARAKTAKIS